MSDVAEQSIRELSAEIESLTAQCAKECEAKCVARRENERLAADNERFARELLEARNALAVASRERDELIATMLRIEEMLVKSSESLDKFLIGIGAAQDEAPPSTASSRPVERFTHDVKGNKLS